MNEKEESQTISELELISCSVDGELSEFEMRRLDQLLQSTTQAGSWERYHLISDVLQGHFPKQMRRDFSDRVMKEIAGQSNGDSQSGYSQSGSPKGRPGRKGLKHIAQFSLAASVAVVAIVMFQLVQEDQSTGPVVQELVLAQPKSDEIPQITPASAASDVSQQFPVAYPSVDVVSTQLIGSTSNAVNTPSATEYSTDDFLEEIKADPEVINPYIINHAGVASERVFSPYLQLPPDTIRQGQSAQ